MRGRMIHTQAGDLDSQLYDRDGQVSPRDFILFHGPFSFFLYITQCIHSLDRVLLNEGLLEEAAASENIRLFFNHRVLSVNFDDRILTVKDKDSTVILV